MTEEESGAEGDAVDLGEREADGDEYDEGQDILDDEEEVEENDDNDEERHKKRKKIRRLMAKQRLLLLLVLLSWCLQASECFWPFSSSYETSPNPARGPRALYGEHAAEFSIVEGDSKGRGRLEDAMRKLEGPNTCWHKAYRNLFASCSEIMSDKEKQHRLAYQLSDCYQRDTGRPPFPTCRSEDPMPRCFKKLDDVQQNIHLSFLHEAGSICLQLQNGVFKHETERLINDLASSARFAEEKLHTIEERSKQLLQGTSKLHDSMSSLELQTQQAAQASRDVGSHIGDVMKHSETIYEQSKGIAASQQELQEGQAAMKERLELGMTNLHESYESLGEGFERLRGETVQIGREIKQVGDSMFSKLQDLHVTTNDIGNVAEISLEKHKLLLDSQSAALEDLDALKKFQSQLFEEAQYKLQKLAEDFETNQATVIAFLNKIFALLNVFMVDNRFIKALLFYTVVNFLFYMLSSAKQTFRIRAQLYLGFCITFVLELGIMKLGSDDFDNQIWITSKIFLLRMSFIVIASIQILYAIFTYRDYEVLNHKLLQSLVEKVCTIEQNAGKFLPSNAESDSSLSDYSWIDDELPDEGSDIDPDNALFQEVGENSVIFSRKYHLRPRAR